MKKFIATLLLVSNIVMAQPLKINDFKEESWTNLSETVDGNLFIAKSSFKKENGTLSLAARFIPNPPDTVVLYYTLHFKIESCKDKRGQILMRDTQGHGESIANFDFLIVPQDEDSALIIKAAKLMCQYNQSNLLKKETS